MSLYAVLTSLRHLGINVRTGGRSAFSLNSSSLLWFARKASRLSLAHALFLVAIVGGLWFPDLPDTLPISLSLFWEPARILATGILAVWLLSNFDLRSNAFRKWAIVAVVAWQGLDSLSDLLQALDFVVPDILAWGFYFKFLLLASALSLPITLLLVYFVRVRRPSTKAPTTHHNEEN